jgi:thioredoxin
MIKFMTQEFTQDSFSTDVIEASKNKPVLVDFFASWCGPCQIQGPIVDEVSEEVGEKAIVGKLNTENAMEVARQFGIMSIPTIIIFRNGQPAERFTGVQEKEMLMEGLHKHA